MEIKRIPDQIINGELIPLELKEIDAIAFHHTASKTMNVKEIEAYHINHNGWVAIAYNYFIEKDGTIYKGRGFSKAAAVTNHNSHILSICFQGNFEEEYPTDAQYISARELTKHLTQCIPSIKKISLHKDWNNTACPGRNFNIEKILKEELTSVNDIVFELSALGIVTDKALWLKKLEEDKNAYHLARKCLNKIRGIL